MIDLDAIEARIRDCKTYNFGLWNADKLAHEDAPAMLTELRHLRVIASGNQGAIVNSIIERTRHKATDDERESLAQIIAAAETGPGYTSRFAPMGGDYRAADAILAAGFHRSEPQGEPSDAQVLAALNAHDGANSRYLEDWSISGVDRMRAILRAAEAAR